MEWARTRQGRYEITHRPAVDLRWAGEDDDDDAYYDVFVCARAHVYVCVHAR